MGMRLQPPGWQDSRPNPRGKHHDEQMRVSTPIIGRGVRPWRAGRWLPSRSSPQKVNPTSKYRLASGLSVSPPSRERQILTTPRQTPAMTMALRKLQKILPEFCNTMAECRFLKCCSLLGSILLVKSTSSGRAFSPVTSFLGGPSSPSSKSSPGRSPIRAWLTGGGESLRHDSSNSLDEMNAAALLESHMEVFFLLVGAESMYTSMAHVISLHFCQVLTACYEQAVKDLQLLRFSLSDAVLMNPASDGHQIINDPETFHAASAEGLVASLLSLVSFCQARIQCIQLQSVLWHSPPQPSSAPNFAELAALFASIPPNTRLATTNDDKGQSSSLAAVETLVNVTLNEISVWSALCQTAFSVQHCQ